MNFCTVIDVPPGSEDEVEALFTSIQVRDPTWKWRLVESEGQLKALVFSVGKHQAKQRGEWLTRRTNLFRGQKYEVTRKTALKTALREKPREAESIRGILKRDHIWEEASRGE